MAKQVITPESSAIQWNFILAEQGFITRYGRVGDVLYKQYMPGGIEVPQFHPPKRIDKKTYTLAYNQYLKQFQSTPS